MDNIEDLIWVLYSLLMTVLGHSLYRVNKKLGLKPIINRLLFGIMGSALYVGAHFLLIRNRPQFNYINMLILFIVGYYVESVVGIIDNKLPEIIDRIIDLYLPRLRDRERSGGENRKRGEGDEQRRENEDSES